MWSIRNTDLQSTSCLRFAYNLTTSHTWLEAQHFTSHEMCYVLFFSFSLLFSGITMRKKDGFVACCIITTCCSTFSLYSMPRGQHCNQKLYHDIINHWFLFFYKMTCLFFLKQIARIFFSFFCCINGCDIFLFNEKLNIIKHKFVLISALFFWC